MTDAPDEEKRALLSFLESQRASMLSIVEGLGSAGCTASAGCPITRGG